MALAQSFGVPHHQMRLYAVNVQPGGEEGRPSHSCQNLNSISCIRKAIIACYTCIGYSTCMDLGQLMVKALPIRAQVILPNLLFASARMLRYPQPCSVVFWNERSYDPHCALGVGTPEVRPILCVWRAGASELGVEGKFKSEETCRARPP